MTTRWDRTELDDLVGALTEADPTAATLCEGWQTRHLAAHLYLRRHRPWLATRQGPGSELQRLAETARDPDRYRELVQHFAAAPHPLTPMALGDGPLGPWVNLLEYVVHHEDVRRGGDGSDGVPPRTVPAELADAVFDQVAQMARVALRSLDVGVVLVVPGGRRRVVRRGPDAVAVVGAPIELALTVMGRLRAADVELLGEPDAVERFRAAQA